MIVALDAVIPVGVIPEIVIGATNERVVVVEEPFIVPVMVTVWSAEKAFELAKKTPLAEPAGMVTVLVTARLAEFELRATLPPPVPLRATLQRLEESGARVTGVQEMELIVVTPLVPTLTPPPLPVTAIVSPAGEAPKLLPMPIGAALLPDKVTETVATTPSEMVVEFTPQATHVTAPEPPAQLTVLPADESAAPAVTFKLVTFAAE